jgi:hypothetical protein
LVRQRLEEEDRDYKSPGPPGWGLLQRASHPTSKIYTAKKPKMKEDGRDYLRRNRVLYLTVKLYLLCKRDLLDSCQVPDLEIHVEVCLRLEISSLPCGCIFSLMNFVVNNQEHFHTK